MSKLFEPLEIGKLKIANRLVRSATYYALSDQDGFISDGSIELMKTLAEGDIGLIITGYAFVIKHGQVFPDMNGIDQDAHIPAYRKMTQAVHDRNGKIVMQIAHGGSLSTYAAKGDGDYVAVSLTDALPDYGRKPKVLTEDDIQTTIEAFGQAARRVQESGFDGVQIHGAHGYLVSEFLSPTTNQRQDRWGGSLENRSRFLVEVIRSIKRNVADDFPVLIKLGCRDYLDEGTGLTIEEGREVAQTVEKEGVSLIEISHGRIGKTFRKSVLRIKAPEKEAYMLEAAKAIRSVVSIPICLVGGMRSMPVIEGILNDGIVDLVSLCRPFIREPGLVKRLKKGEKIVVDCISCWKCINPDKDGKNHVFCRQLHKQQAL
ncbi:MAG: NADH:flavin oxidoreductase [SAR324 cluster bacterium]|nr:NADH:flavin oxidoreductase [SAR324 cluster bacterium]